MGHPVLRGMFTSLLPFLEHISLLSILLCLLFLRADALLTLGACYIALLYLKEKGMQWQDVISNAICWVCC